MGHRIMTNTFKASVFGVLLAIGFIIGGTLTMYLFAGICTLIGLIVLVETIPLLKWILRRTSQAVDVIIFVLTLVASFSAGVTVAMSYMVAGLGFTLIYAPMLKYRD